MKQLLILLIATLAFTSCYEDELRPAATFSTTGFVPGFKWRLDASGSVSANGKIISYRWDYDEDQSQYDTPWLSDPVFITGAEPSDNDVKIVSLQIKDDAGLYGEISQRVTRSRIVYGLHTSTIQDGNVKVRYNRYHRFEGEQSVYSDWMLQNVYLRNNASAINLPDSLQQGSYLSWQAADTLQMLGFTLPSKEEWQRIIDLFFGNDLAGFNLQVDNVYSIGLDTDGYIHSNQLLKQGENGYFWTSTEVNETNAWAVEIIKNADSVQFVSLPKSAKCKTRLVKIIIPGASN